VLTNLEAWIRRRLRSYLWRQWQNGHNRFTELPIHTTGHTGHVPRRFDWVKLGQKHGVGGGPIANAVSNRANSLVYARNKQREMRDPYVPLMS